MLHDFSAIVEGRPSKAKWTAYAHDLRQKGARHVPSSQVFISRFGSWSRAIVLALGPAVRRMQADGYSQDDIRTRYGLSPEMIQKMN